MLLVETYLDESDIQGHGVFAVRAIPKGTKIWEFNKRFDKIILEKEVKNIHPVAAKLFDKYSYPYKNKAGVAYRVLDCDNGRFMNHSEDPNCRWLHDYTGVAVRDIAKGEELTCDYSAVR